MLSQSTVYEHMADCSSECSAKAHGASAPTGASTGGALAPLCCVPRPECGSRRDIGPSPEIVRADGSATRTHRVTVACIWPTRARGSGAFRPPHCTASGGRRSGALCKPSSKRYGTRCAGEGVFTKQRIYECMTCDYTFDKVPAQPLPFGGAAFAPPHYI